MRLPLVMWSTGENDEYDLIPETTADTATHYPSHVFTTSVKHHARIAAGMKGTAITEKR